MYCITTTTCQFWVLLMWPSAPAGQWQLSWAASPAALPCLLGGLCVSPLLCTGHAVGSSQAEAPSSCRPCAALQSLCKCRLCVAAQSACISSTFLSARGVLCCKCKRGLPSLCCYVCSQPCSHASHRLGWACVTGNTYAPMCSNSTNDSSRSPAASSPLLSLL